MHMLYFYVNEENAEDVKDALFSAGAGRFNNYEKCCFQTSGTGQFLPLKDSDPFIGAAGSLEKVKEVKVEMICRDEDVEMLKKVLVDSHPYEEPAYGFIKIYS